MNALFRTLTERPAKESNINRMPKALIRCPNCEKSETMRVSHGMILCNYCFWAMEIKSGQ